MLLTFCSLAVSFLPASTIAAAVVESEGFNPLESNGIYRNTISGLKGQMFEKDKRNEQLGGELGRIQLKVRHRHLFNSLISGLTGYFRAQRMALLLPLF